MNFPSYFVCIYTCPKQGRCHLVSSHSWMNIMETLVIKETSITETPVQICIFLVAKLLYKSKCPSVHLYVCLSVCTSGLGGSVIFSAPNWDIALIFCVQIPLINEQLFCKYFVRLSVGNARQLCYLWMFSSLFIEICKCIPKTASKNNSI